MGRTAPSPARLLDPPVPVVAEAVDASTARVSAWVGMQNGGWQGDPCARGSRLEGDALCLPAVAILAEARSGDRPALAIRAVYAGPRASAAAPFP